MPLNPTPQRKQIFQFPTPNLEDRVFYELHDSTQMNYTVPEYGTPHPNQSKYAGYVFALVKSANEAGWVMWFYLNERANQDAYNYEISYPYADTDYPAYIRTYVLLRENLVEPAAGTPDPVYGLDYILTNHKQTRLGDPVLDSLFVGVQRAYEKLPGPVIESYVINGRGDVETQFEQAVPSGTELQADGLFVTKSALEYESTVKGKKVYSTVGQYSVLTGKVIVDAFEGVEGTISSAIVDSSTALPALGSSASTGYVIAATKSPISATKAELKLTTISTLPSVKRTYFNERGEIETEVTKHVLATSPADAKPATDGLKVVKSAYIQDSLGFGRVITTTVPDYLPTESKAYSSDYKGALVYEFSKIVSPLTPQVTPGSNPNATGSYLPSNSKVVASSVSKKTATKAVQRIVAIDAWPVLYDYFFEDELGSWVSVKYEILKASDIAEAFNDPASQTPAPFVDVAYKAIDAFWTAKTTKTVLSTTTVGGQTAVFRVEHREQEYDFPAIFLGMRIFSVVDANGRDYTGVQPVVLSGVRKYVQAQIQVIYCASAEPLETDSFGQSTTPTTIIPVNVAYNGVLLRFDAGRCLCSGGQISAFSGSNSAKWQPPLVDTYVFPTSYPQTMPQEVTLPTRITPWRYNLYRHEIFTLNTDLPGYTVDFNTGAISFDTP